MNTEKTIVAWTKPMLERFRKAYTKAVADKQDEFTFEGNKFVSGYAEYLIEYLDMMFRTDNK